MNELSASTSPELQVSLPAQDEPGDFTVTFYGRPTGSHAPDFTVVLLPDTQFYSAVLNGGLPEMFQSQTDWCVSNHVAHSLAYVLHLGDVVNYGDTHHYEWQNATNALYRLDEPLTTGLSDGIPYGVLVGNHDQSGNGTTAIYYNRYFGMDRFAGRSYYGGNYGTNNNNHYGLFNAGGMDFIVVCLEYDTSANPAVLSWANNLLQAHSNRHAIVASHYIGTDTTPSTFSPQGAAIYNALKTNANLFLMVGGHVHSRGGEGSRTDVFNGNTVRTLISNYQSYPNGGNGFMRLMRFSPANGVMYVSTYSPWLDQYKMDAASQFTVPMPSPLAPPYPGGEFIALGTNTSVSPGTITSMPWPDLQPSRTYEWYVTVADISHAEASPLWRFTTRPKEGSDLSLQLNGGGFVDITRAAANMNSVGDFTISGWFNIHNKGAPQFLFRITNHESNTRRIQAIESAGIITADIRPVANGTVYSVSSGAFNHGKWLHIAFVRSGDELRVYFNGQQVGAESAVTNLLAVNRWAYIGANTYNSAFGGFGNPDSFMVGAVDEFQVWTVAQTAEEIRNSMFQEIAGAPGLLARWPFNEGTGTTALDATTNNLDGTISSGFWIPSTWVKPILRLTWEGSNLVLTWDQPGDLLEATSILPGTWSTVPGAASPFHVNRTTGPGNFFRLRR
jgi:hypothetical protein